jgi:hypothetical protein
MKTISDLALTIVLDIIAFFAAIGVSIALILTAVILYPFYYWRVTVIILAALLGLYLSQHIDNNFTL